MAQRSERLRLHLLPLLLRPGSTDWLLTVANGVAIPDARFHIETDDGAFIYGQSRGYVTGPQEVLASWSTDPSITPDRYR